MSKSGSEAPFLRLHHEATMKTITFYSYKGGTGRSLALANAALYLARLEFRVVALDFDLEAPGLHYKFSTSSNGKALPVKSGVVDYLHSFIVDGQSPGSLKNFTVDVSVPGIVEPPIHLIPAGCGPSKEYWLKLSRINWHELFYSNQAKGVQIFLDLKNRIADEIKPDFLLVDSRTGITEMGGVATTMLADKIIALVLPSRENLEGTRAVLRSIRRSRRESSASEIEMIVALSRLPRSKESKSEQDQMGDIRSILNEEAEDLKDTLSCSEVFVLHSEPALEIRESLRVGSGVGTDESILLRDYLRLFANVVPRELIEPKIGNLIQQAKEKIWEDPEAALKEMEEVAESFGHPESYRTLLRFYEVRNVRGTRVLKKAQQLWDLTRNTRDPAIWQALFGAFEVKPRWQREKEWFPDLNFVAAVWHDAGKKNPEFGAKLAEAFSQEDHESRAADVLLEIIRTSEAEGEIVSRCIAFLDIAKRMGEASALIQELKPRMLTDVRFIEAWARHALRIQDIASLTELLQPPIGDLLYGIRPYIAAQVSMRAGSTDQASLFADGILQEIGEKTYYWTDEELETAAKLFHELGRWDEFEKKVDENIAHPMILGEIRRKLGRSSRSR